MSTATPIPISGARKRRRSTEKLLNEIAQRGISVQHVANDARQLNANDIGQLQHLFRSSRNRIGCLSFRDRMRPAMNLSSPNSATFDEDHLRSLAMSAVLRLSNPARVVQTNNADRSNPNASSRISRVDRPIQQATVSNLSPNWQFLRVGNSSLGELYRCALTTRGQQTSDASRHDQVRLIRRIRRARSSANTESGR